MIIARSSLVSATRLAGPSRCSAALCGVPSSTTPFIAANSRSVSAPASSNRLSSDSTAILSPLAELPGLDGSGMSLLLHRRHLDSRPESSTRRYTNPVLCESSLLSRRHPSLDRRLSCWLPWLVVKSQNCEPLQTYFYTPTVHVVENHLRTELAMSADGHFRSDNHLLGAGS